MRHSAARRRSHSRRLHEIREGRWSPLDRHPCLELELSDGARMRVQSDGAPETLAALRALGEAAVARMREGGAG
jgi:hypothetical protein